mgnify:CR=1 FL=1|tara:strand:+ start:1429 stop:1695 length:267 start_codon:yes stop_codon:yes gene_type:complete
MCNPFSTPKPPGPSAEDIRARESARQAQRDALKEERRSAEQIKEEQLELAQAAAAGRRGRRSLMAGRKKGGSGFDVADIYQTKGTLGA